MNKIDFSKIKFIFFDFDGVIVDTEKLHLDSFNNVIRDYKIQITKKEYFDKYMAYDDKGCFRDVFYDKLRIKLSLNKIKSLINKKTKLLMQKIKNNLIVYNDTIEFIDFIRKKFPKIKLGIVSGALKNELKFVLKKLNIEKYFSFIISAQDVNKGKPDPEPFIKAKHIAQKILHKKLTKKEVVVIEDSINGIKSAKKLGFIIIAVAHTYSYKKLKKIHNVVVVNKMTDLY